MEANISEKDIPKVSVVIPIYNVEKYLKECLDSVINQTLKEIEIICVNDGSTDDSLSIVEQYASDDERFVIIDKKNAGYGHTMNRGFEKARGEYIGITESDDYIAPTMYEELYNAAKQNDIDIVKSDYFEFETTNGRNKSVHVKTCELAPEYYNRVLIDNKEKILFHFRMNTWTGIYRTDFIRQHKIAHNESPGASHQDNGFWFQTVALAKSIYFMDKAFYYYRQDNPNSSINAKNKVYAMNDEFAFIENCIDGLHPISRSKLLAAFVEKRFFNYYDMLWRLSEEFRKDFMQRACADFWNMDKKKYIPYYELSDYVRKMVCRIMDDWETFYYEEKENRYLNKLKQTLNEVENSKEFKRGDRIRRILMKHRLRG